MPAALYWHDAAQEMAHRSHDREAVACALVDRAMARTDQGAGTAGVWRQIIPDAPSTARRDIGVWVARQATLSASLREPECTVELARHAVKAALETGSARVRRELAAAKVTMTPWQTEPVGRDFAEVLAPISEGI
jgi:hypothetical protein